MGKGRGRGMGKRGAKMPRMGRARGRWRPGEGRRKVK